MKTLTIAAVAALFAAPALAQPAPMAEQDANATPTAEATDSTPAGEVKAPENESAATDAAKDKGDETANSADGNSPTS